MKVMSIKHVCKINAKGMTALVGTLECDLRSGDEITIVTRTESRQAKVWCLETFVKTHESAKAGEEMAVMVRGIINLDVQEGDTVEK